MERGIGRERLSQELLGGTDLERVKKFPEYLKFEDAMKAAKELQPGDPKDPSADFAYEVLTQLEGLLDAEDKISFYTAVGTILASRHGIDAWFEVDDGPMATVGIGKRKADVDIDVPRDGLDRNVDEQQFLKYATELAQVLAARLSGKQEERLVYQAS